MGQVQVGWDGMEWDRTKWGQLGMRLPGAEWIMSLRKTEFKPLALPSSRFFCCTALAPNSHPSRCVRSNQRYVGAYTKALLHHDPEVGAGTEERITVQDVQDLQEDFGSVMRGFTKRVSREAADAQAVKEAGGEEGGSYDEGGGLTEASARSVFKEEITSITVTKTSRLPSFLHANRVDKLDGVDDLEEVTLRLGDNLSFGGILCAFWIVAAVAIVVAAVVAVAVWEGGGVGAEWVMVGGW